MSRALNTVLSRVLYAALFMSPPAIAVSVALARAERRASVPVTAKWQYSQLEMEQCAWCGRAVKLNRHHIIPQSANPALRDVRENLIVLCRECHFVLGHRCDWKQYNPDVLQICSQFTNRAVSAETRQEAESTEEDAPQPVFVPPDPEEMTESQKKAIERITRKWKRQDK